MTKIHVLMVSKPESGVQFVETYRQSEELWFTFRLVALTITEFMTVQHLSTVNSKSMNGVV